MKIKINNREVSGVDHALYHHGDGNFFTADIGECRFKNKSKAPKVYDLAYKGVSIDIEFDTGKGIIIGKFMITTLYDGIKKGRIKFKAKSCGEAMLNENN